MTRRYTAEEGALYEQYRAAGQAIERAALEDFIAVFNAAVSSDAQRFAGRLVPIYQALVSKYGAMQAELAAQFYDEMRTMRVTNAAFSADPAQAATAAALEQNILTALQSMFTPGKGGGPDVVMTRAQGALLRQIRNAGRSTLMRSSRDELAATGSAPRFARLLRGETNCPWCVMLASKGPVFWSKQRASAPTDGWHDHCDCEIALIADGRGPAGYDQTLQSVQDLYYANQYGDDPSRRIYQKADRQRVQYTYRPGDLDLTE